MKQYTKPKSHKHSSACALWIYSPYNE